MKKIVCGLLLAGLALMPAVSFGQSKTFDSVRVLQYLKVPNLDSDIVVRGKTPKITIGDKGAEDTMLLLDGNAQDWHFALDDTTDSAVIGLGAVAGTTERITLSPSALSILIGDATGADVWTEYDGNAVNFHTGIDDSADKFVIGLGSVVGTTERMTFNSADLGILIGDATAADSWFTFDGVAQDYYIGLDDGTDDLIIGLGGVMGTTPALSIDENQDVTITNNLIRTSQQHVQTVAYAKLGGSGAGWVIGADDALSLATLPQSQTTETMLIPVTIPLKVGDTITGFSVIGQIESAGNAVTVDADLRKGTAAAGDHTDASVGTITQVSQTADYEINDSVGSLAEVVAANETFYVVILSTTGATTDVAISGITVTVTEN